MVTVGPWWLRWDALLLAPAAGAGGGARDAGNRPLRSLRGWRWWSADGQPPQPAFGRGVGSRCWPTASFSAACRLLPVVEFCSDITEVVYVNYLVPVAQLAALVPPGFRCGLGAGGRWPCLRF